MYKHLFGPVPSRRLGMSLGIDLVPSKVCSLDCVYCEVGKTNTLTSKMDEYITEKEICKELEDYFQHQPDPDTFTLTGSGEPTLNNKLEAIIAFLRKHRPNVNIAILTNGTQLFDPKIRKSLLGVNLVLPSLDAASDTTLIKINRPIKGLSIETYIEGIAAFRALQLQQTDAIKREMWLEIFILPHYNTDKTELDRLKKAILYINPTSVQLNTLDRPGSVKNLVGATRAELMEIKDYWNLDKVEIISANPDRKKIKAYHQNTEKSILETLARRPCTLKDLTTFIGNPINEIHKYLDVMEQDQLIISLKGERGTFYQLKTKVVE